MLKRISRVLESWLRDAGFNRSASDYLSRAIPLTVALIITGVMLFLSIRLLCKQLKCGRRVLPIMSTCAHIACFSIILSLALEQAFANLIVGVTFGLDTIFGYINDVLESIVYGDGGPIQVFSMAFWACAYVAIADVFYTLFAAHIVRDKYDTDEMGNAIVNERALTMTYIVLTVAIVSLIIAF